jgi:hypothetical protein
MGNVIYTTKIHTIPLLRFALIYESDGELLDITGYDDKSGVRELNGAITSGRVYSSVAQIPVVSAIADHPMPLRSVEDVLL